MLSLQTVVNESWKVPLSSATATLGTDTQRTDQWKGVNETWHVSVNDSSLISVVGQSGSDYETFLSERKEGLKR